MNELNELFLTELSDILYAENLLLKALPKMAKAAQSEELREAFQTHAEETQDQVDRIKQVFEIFGKPAKAKKCHAMIGLIEEAKEVMEEWKGSPAGDAALICAAQKVEHYEIATYGCLCTWAEMMGNNKALKLLKQTINEEETTDQKLTDMAESSINQQAENEGGEEEEVDVARPRSRMARANGSARRKQLVS